MSADFLPLADWLRVVARQGGSTGKPFADAADTITALYEALRQLASNAGLARFHIPQGDETDILASALFDTLSQAETALKLARGEEA